MANPIRKTIRKVIRCRRGEAGRWVAEAGRLGAAEIEERDDIPSGEYFLFEEEVVASEPWDPREAWEEATTVEGKLRVLGWLLGLEERP